MARYRSHNLTLFVEQLFNAPVPKPERVITKFVHFWQDQSIMKRLRMLWGRVFLSRRELSRQVSVHPDTLALWRYYPLRFWILIRRYGRQVLRLLRKDQDQLAVLEQHSNQNNLERWLSG